MRAQTAYRRGCLQYRDHRLSGNLHRPLLRRPDRRAHVPADRQLRRESRRQGIRRGRGSKAWWSASSRRIASNWRAEESAEQFLAENGIPVAAEIDTRALVRHLRSRGVMRGVLSASAGADVHGLVERARNVAVDGGPRSGYERQHHVELRVGHAGRAGARRRTTCRRRARSAATWWPTTSASSATFCGSWSGGLRA